MRLISLVGLAALTSCTSYGNNQQLNAPYGQVSDVDRNEYRTIKIGKNTWMADNLATTHYNDGTPILEGIYKYPTTEEYGLLYSWNNSQKSICPTGWHVSTDQDWKDLEATIGIPLPDLEQTGWRGSSEHGLKIYQYSLSYFGDIESQNQSKFSAIPSGAKTRRETFVAYWGAGVYADYWTSSESSQEDAWNRSLVLTPWHPRFGKIFRGELNKEFGFSIRCVKNSL